MKKIFRRRLDSRFGQKASKMPFLASFFKGGVQFRAIWTKKIFFRNTCWNSDFLISFYMRNTKAKWQKLFDSYNAAFGRAMMREGIRFEVTSWKVGSKIVPGRKFKKFFNKWPLGVILCGESIARTPEPWKCFLDPDSEKESVYWRENQTFSDFYEKTVDS